MIKFFFILLSLHTFYLAEASYQRELKIAISASPSNLNPFFAVDSNSQNIDKLIHISLVDINDQMKIVCNLCLNFEERIENKKHIILFNLKKNMYFSDRSPLVAKDVFNSWKYYAKDEKIKSTFMGSFETIEDVRIIDKYKLEIVFKTYSLENLTNLNLLKIVKINQTDHSNLKPEDILGAGEYVIRNIEPLQITIDPRDNSRPTLVFKVVKDETTLALKLINREIDLSVASLSPRKIQWLEKKSEILSIWDIPSSNYMYIALNFNNDLVKDRRFRQALSLLVPRESLLKYKLKNTATLSNGMFSPAFKDMYQAKGIDKFDQILARKLFTEMGIIKDNDGKLIYKNKPIILDWKVNNNKASIEIVEIIKNYFEKEGIVVNMLIQEWGTFMNSYTTGKFDLLIGQWMGFSGPNMLDFVYNSKNIPPVGGNRIYYRNKVFDQTIEMALGEQNSASRLRLFQKAYDIINNDQVYINLWHPNIIWVGSKCLKNIKLDPTGSFNTLPKVELNCEK